MQAPVNVQLQGLNHFRHQVLYVHITPSEQLTKLSSNLPTKNICLTVYSECVYDHFNHNKLTFQKYRFTPHITILKVRNKKHMNHDIKQVFDEVKKNKIFIVLIVAAQRKANIYERAYYNSIWSTVV